MTCPTCHRGRYQHAPGPTDQPPVFACSYCCALMDDQRTTPLVRWLPTGVFRYRFARYNKDLWGLSSRGWHRTGRTVEEARAKLTVFGSEWVHVASHDGYPRTWRTRAPREAL